MAIPGTPSSKSRGRTMSESAADSPSKRSVVDVVEEMVKQKLVTLIVPSLVLDEFRGLGWIYPWRLGVSVSHSVPLRTCGSVSG